MRYLTGGGNARKNQHIRKSVQGQSTKTFFVQKKTFPNLTLQQLWPGHEENSRKDKIALPLSPSNI